MRKTVLLIRFALCIAIGLVGSGLFATARAIAIPNPFVKAHELAVEKFKGKQNFASVALAASVSEKPLTSTALATLITSPKLIDPIPATSSASESKEHTENSINGAGVLSDQVTASLVSDLPTPTPDPLPEITPITSPASTDSPTPTPILTAPGTAGLSASMLFALVNQTRTQAGLPAFETNDAVCSLASIRSPEIHNEIYGSSYMHAGFFARAAGSGMTENIISMNSEQSALTWWLNSPIHRQSLMGAYKYSCLSCTGDSCSEIFSN